MYQGCHARVYFFMVGNHQETVIVDQATSSLMIWGPHHMVSVTLLLFTLLTLYCRGVLKNETTVEYNRVDGQTVVE